MAPEGEATKAVGTAALAPLAPSHSGPEQCFHKLNSES